MTLKNKIALITGASSGIGAASAKRFAEAGAKLILCARRIDRLQTLAHELTNSYHTEVNAIQLDVTQQNEVEQLIQNLSPDWKDIDILINNAGLAYGLETLQDSHVKDWDAVIDTNVKGLLYVTKAILPIMIEKNAGHIINLGSVAGHVVYPKGAVYCATKHAVHAITQGLRMDLFGKKIRVSSIDPGAVETEFSLVRFRGDTKRAANVYEGMTPLTADDIADAILYCATRPPHVNISEIIMMPTDQAAATLIAREGK